MYLSIYAITQHKRSCFKKEKHFQEGLFPFVLKKKKKKVSNRELPPLERETTLVNKNINPKHLLRVSPALLHTLFTLNL